MTKAQPNPDFWNLTVASAEESIELYFDPIRRLASWISHRARSRRSRQTDARARNLHLRAADIALVPNLVAKLEKLTEEPQWASTLMRRLTEQGQQLQELTEKVDRVLEAASGASHTRERPQYDSLKSEIRALTPWRESRVELDQSRARPLLPDRILREATENYRRHVEEIFQRMVKLAAPDVTSQPSFEFEPGQEPGVRLGRDAADLTGQVRILSLVEELLRDLKESDVSSRERELADELYERDLRQRLRIEMERVQGIMERLRQEAKG